MLKLTIKQPLYFVIAVNVLKRWVSADLVNYQVNRNDLPLEEKGALLLEAAKVDFSSISARGTAHNIIMRVELKPNPALPLDAPVMRYYRMRYSMIIGWEQVPRTASSLTYFLALFML